MIDRHEFDAQGRHVWISCSECRRLDLNGTLEELRAILFAGLDR